MDGRRYGHTNVKIPCVVDKCWKTAIFGQYCEDHNRTGHNFTGTGWVSTPRRISVTPKGEDEDENKSRCDILGRLFCRNKFKSKKAPKKSNRKAPKKSDGKTPKKTKNQVKSKSKRRGKSL